MPPTEVIPLSVECGALRDAAMKKIVHLYDYVTDNIDGSPHLPCRTVDYRSANCVVEETLAAYDAAVAAGASIPYSREDIENMHRGAQCAYARRTLSRTYHAAIARITGQGDMGDPRTLLDEALQATKDIPPQNNMLQNLEALKDLVMRACARNEEEAS